MRYSFILLVTAVAMFPGSATAGIYKCTDDDGNITYSQAPCPNQQNETVKTTGSASRADAAECSDARQFALLTARQMRAGGTSDVAFNRHGGLGAMSKGSINLINYVYSFRTNPDVAVERIAALTSAKCQAGALGDVRCESLPPAWVESIGGCDVDKRAENLTARAMASPSTASALGRSATVQTTPSAGVTSFRPEEDEDDAREECRKRYQDRIDLINSRMRGGYSVSQGESYRRQLRELKDKKREC